MSIISQIRFKAILIDQIMLYESLKNQPNKEVVLIKIFDVKVLYSIKNRVYKSRKYGKKMSNVLFWFKNSH